LALLNLTQLASASAHRSQPVQIPLQSLPTLEQIDTPTQRGVICKLTERTLNPLIEIIDKDVKQDRDQICLLNKA